MNEKPHRSFFIYVDLDPHLLTSQTVQIEFHTSMEIDVPNAQVTFERTAKPQEDTKEIRSFHGKQKLVV